MGKRTTVSFTIPSGIVKSMGVLEARGRYIDGDHVRFSAGKVEKIGGWSKLTSEAIDGIARAAITWPSATATTKTAVATTEKVYTLDDDNLLEDITPRLRMWAVSGAFSTTSGSSTVTVTHTSHGASTGDVVTISQMDGLVGGLDMEGNRTITVLTANTYTFTHGGTASATEALAGIGVITYKKALTSAFTTVSGSPTVTVAFSVHGMVVGQTFIIDSASGTVGGLTMNGTWQVASVVNANSFTFTHTSNASSSAGPTASCNITMDYPPGEINSIAAYGFGIGDFGEEDYGTPRTATAGTATLYFQPSYWQLASFGRLLMMSPLNGPMFVWDPLENPTVRPARVAGSPTEMRGLFTTPERFLVAWGASETEGGNGDDMLLRWCSQADYFDWTPSATNTANSRKLTVGKQIMAAGVLGEGLSMVWSDTAAYTMRYTGSRFVYETRVAGTHCGCVGPTAWTEAGGRAFWFGNSQFWSYGAGVERVPNQDDILPWLLDQINPDQINKTFCFFNPRFNEVWWLFSCQPASEEPDTYVLYNITDGSWATGTMDRTAAYIVGTTGNERPHLVGTDGYIYTHELGTDADDEALEAYIETGPFQVEEGEALVNIVGFVPDFSDQSEDVTVTLYGRDRPRSTPETDVLTVTESDTLADARIRARHMSLKIHQSAVNGFFAVGQPGVQIGSGGRKR